MCVPSVIRQLFVNEDERLSLKVELIDATVIVDEARP